MDSVAFWFCDPQSQEKFCFAFSCRIKLEIQSVLYCKVWWNWAAQRDPRYCWCCTWVWSVCWAEILSCSVHLAPPIHPGSWRQMLILISCCTSVSRCSSVGSVVYQGGCIFPFPNNISGLKVHFHGLEPCVVLAFWNSQGQADSGSNCSLRTFFIPCLSICFLGAGHGESFRKISLCEALMSL